MDLKEVLRRGLERIAERCPEAPESSPQCGQSFTEVPGGGAGGARRWRVRKGASEDAMLAAAGSLLLDPEYAVPTGGCLRPVALHALSHALDARLASRRAAASSSGRSTADDGKSRKKQRKGGDPGALASVDEPRSAAVMHERACAALGMLLELLPHAKPVAMRYLRATPAPFSRLCDALGEGSGGGDGGGGGAGDDVEGASREHALLVARACVRLLRALGPAADGSGARAPSTPDRDDDTAGASTAAHSGASGVLAHWDCSRALRLLRHDDPEVRWTISAALERALGLPAETIAALRSSHAPDASTSHAYHEGWEEECASIAIEKAGAYLDPGPAIDTINDDDDDDDDDDALLDNLQRLPAAPGHVRIGGVEVRRRGGADDGGATVSDRSGGAMVPTRSARRNLRAVALALCRDKPLLLEGPAGAGKSAVLEEVASLTGNDDFVTLHLDAQTDSKSLLGSYVVGAAPGEFKWQPGALTQAVARGRWVVIEDVDLAPFEVLAALVPLLEERRLYVPGRGESVAAAEGFQLFGTVTVGGGRSGGSAAAGARADPLAGLWARVAVEPPAGDEPMEVLCGVHPRLTPLAPAMLDTLNVVQRMCGQGGAAAAPGGTKSSKLRTLPGFEDEMDAEMDGGTEEMDVDMEVERPKGLVRGSSVEGTSFADSDAAGGPRVHAGRPFTLRDLLRWARRLEKMRRTELSLIRAGKTKADSLPPKVKRAAYEEAADVLGGMLPAGPGRRRVLEAMAGCWGLGADVAEHTDVLHKPAMQRGAGGVAVGRAVLPASDDVVNDDGRWAKTGHAMRILERVAAAVQMTEPVLLVGETGTGKTALVQQLARVTGAPLTVVNLSNQSESADFLGGFRPAGARHLCLPLLPKFKSVFEKTFPSAANAEFMNRVVRYGEKRKWTHLLHAMRAGVERVAKLAAAADEEEEKQEEVEEKKPAKRKREKKAKGKKAAAQEEEEPTPEGKKKRALPDDLVADWRQFERELSTAERACGQGGGPVFAFVEGALVTALKEGRWILLDEINLAPAETLERLGGVLESAHGSVVLSERGDGAAVPRHPRFRLFGAMNPATDVGKRDLPAALKHRFTEIYAGECEQREDLALLVKQGLRDAAPGSAVEAIVDFYLAARKDAATTLLDSADQKPQYSLRTLSRAMEYVRAAAPVYGVQRALYDGFAMSFQTLLQAPSAAALEKLMVKHLLRGQPLKAIFKAPAAPPDGTHELIEQYWVEGGSLQREDPEASGRYVVTPGVKTHLSSLARAALLRRHPILLQGPTSSGKTSLVEYLAQRTGHRFMRINNHEHTDLQEYLGSYVTDANGNLSFQEGALVQAVRRGYWIVLDELNLAPSDVLEALNRLLDDNRELFVPELQETITPHPHFMLFATQNPPGATYGGRKVLSKAFRNRFMEIHVGDIPDEELKIILNKRCAVAPSYCTKLVEVMRELQRRRQASRAFAGKDGFITARDLFRWANRQSNGYEELAADGFRVLGERLRSDEERDAMRTVLAKVLKTPPLLDENMYAAAEDAALKTRLDEAAAEAAKRAEAAEKSASNAAAAADARSAKQDATDAAQLSEAMAWTPAMCRLFSLVEACMNHKEPALLVGETGCGKTSVCQLLALLRGQKLRILNCHQHTETGDFLGGFRPTRPTGAETDDNDDDAEGGIVDKKAAAPFAWEDGPLIKAMRDGDILLVDELSLAEDSVLERLNSVLEPGRTLTLPEKGGSEVEELVAHPNFLLLATMNPGGDFGKKELSPALRNRFNEIWVGATGDAAEMEQICARRIPEPELKPFASHLARFWEFYREIAGRGAARAALLTRDLVAWAQFVRAAAAGTGSAASGCNRRLAPAEAFAHGAYLTLLDGLGLGLGLPEEMAKGLAEQCKQFLRDELPPEAHAAIEAAANPGGDHLTAATGDGAFIDRDGIFGIAPFAIPRGPAPPPETMGFELSAPSTRRNAARVLRAMQLPKPILLEGSPGVGKTSLVSALAKAAGHNLVRINLSEQTDMMDLLGADLPADGGAAGEFRWADGAFLAALKNGDWVLLDELNLAPQPVLEGLNAALDHRAEVFVPELGETFRCPPTFRVFAAQNPVQEGGGRKGLPKSFLNRFTRVHVEPMERSDLVHITAALYPAVPTDVIERMVHFVGSLADASKVVGGNFARAGAPWEFNLRDLLRWCDLAGKAAGVHHGDFDRAVDATFETLFSQRLRTAGDRVECVELFAGSFGRSPRARPPPAVSLRDGVLHVGDACFPLGASNAKSVGAGDHDSLGLLRGQLPALEAAAHCCAEGWMTIVAGPAASGKTSLVQTLATLAGRTLRQVALTAATDTSELLGSFEQKEPSRDRAALEEDAYAALRWATAKALRLQSGVSAVTFEAAWSAWSAYRAACETSAESAGAEEADAAKAALVKAIDALDLVQSETAESDPDVHMDVDGESLGDESLASSLHARVADLGPEAWGGVSPAAGRFEWVDGVLLKAAVRGEWVLLDNANLCSPTVLDRLNPLLEIGGSLLVSECGMRDGVPRVITAHPGFRLFLALDPRRGEVSRAMRNRGVEVFLMPPENAKALRALPETASAPDDTGGPEDLTLPAPLVMPPERHTVECDLAAVLAAAGVPPGPIRAAMTAAHRALVDPPVPTDDDDVTAKAVAASSAAQHTAREAARWAALVGELLARGAGAGAALAAAWDHVYARGEASDAARDAAAVAFRSGCVPYLEALRETSSSGYAGALVEPLGWPASPAAARSLASSAGCEVARIDRAGALVESSAAALHGRELIVDANGDARVYRSAPALAAAALPIGALRARMAIAATTDSFAENSSEDGSSLMDLARGLRAAGAALVTGAAFGEGAATGLTPRELGDVAAWLRRLAARFAGVVGAEGSLPLPPDESSLGASNELTALAEASDALAGHPISVLESLKQGSRSSTAAKLRALAFRGAVAAARVDPHATRSSGSSSGTLLQLATWRRANPGERGRGDRVHPAVDALATTLSSADGLERAVLSALCAALARNEDSFAIQTATAAMAAAQDWRLRLESFAASTPASKLRHGSDGIPPDGAAVERLAVAYSLLREAAAESASTAASADAGNLSVPHSVAANAAAETPARAWEAWQHASGRMNVALGIPPGDGAPPALLWRAGGHPLVPRTEALRRAEERVRFLCAALRPAGASGSDVAAVAAAVAAREGEDHDAARAVSATIERATLAASAAVGSGGGAGLRSAALEGLCFFAWTHVGGGVRSGAEEDTDAAAFLETEAASIPAQIADECSKLAAAATAPKAQAATPLVGSGDDENAMAIDTVEQTDDAVAPPAPREYDMNSAELLRSADVFEGVNGAGGQKPPAPLGFPVWSQKYAKCRIAHESLLPLLELHSLASQVSLLEAMSARVARVSLASVDSDGYSKYVDHALTGEELGAAARGLAFGLASAPRDPADFVAHRHLLWLAGSSIDAGSDMGTDTSEGDKLASSLPSLAHAMWRSWHGSGWGGVLHDVPPAHVPKMRTKRFEHDLNTQLDRTMTHAATCWSAAYGPVRAERATATFLATALVATHGGMDGVVCRPARALQLRLAARALRLRTDGSHSKRIAQEWSALGSLTAQALAAHASAAPVDRRPELASALANLTAWASTDARTARSAGEAAALREALSNAASAVDHGPLTALMAPVVGPLVEAIIAGAMRAGDVIESRAIDAFGSVESSVRHAVDAVADRAGRGAAWALLGLLRLHLLLPEGTPDPAAATRAKLERADAKLSQETTPALSTLAWQRRAAAATPPPDAAVQAAETEAESLAAESAELARCVVPRPDPPLWTPMLAEAVRFREQLASVERVTGIVQALAGSDAGGESRHARVAKARAEAVAWLDAAGPWGGRLDVSFPGYRDATEPLQLAALELRRGFSLLVSAAPDAASDGAKAAAARGKVSPAVADAAAAAAAAHLFAFPPLSRVGGGSAAALLASPTTQRALSVIESVAATRDAEARRGGGDAESRKQIARSAAQLRVEALRAALAAAAEEAATSGALSVDSWRGCCDVFASLSSLWAHARDAEAEAEREAAELFRSRTKPPTAAETLEGDDEKTEEEAFRRAFGDHGTMFEDLQRAPDAVMELGDDEGEEGGPRTDGEEKNDSDTESDDEERTDEERASIAAAKIAGLLEGDLLEEVVAVHRRVLGGLRGPPPPPPPPRASDDPVGAAAAAKDPSGWWAAHGAPPTPARYGRVLTPDEAVRAVTFVRSYDVGTKIARAAGLVNVPAAVDEAAATGHLLRASLEHACVNRAALPVDQPMIHRVGKSVKPDLDDGKLAAGAELAAGSEAEAHDPEADKAADALGADLNEGGCAGEMYLVVAPVAAVRRRLTTLLEEWPEHPLLEQLAEICDRVLALPLLSPLKEALTGLELLLARAQTWEEGAASHVSLAEELTACAKLALRWRQRELRTWPRLLARAAERHAQRAHRTWFALHRLLRPPVNKKKSARDHSDEHGTDGPSELDARGLTEEEAEGLRQVTLALEEYVQGSTIGEFRARLDLLWQFHADMAVERVSIQSINPENNAGGAREGALSNVLYNTWRYYVQFLPAVARQVEAARAPCAQKLREHAKLAKWEDRGYHAMKTQGEANQRSLHKFVRAFDVSLNALVLPVLQATNGKVGLPDLPSERGAAEVAAALATAAQTAKEVKNAAIEAKNKAASDAREKHKASSAGLYKNETIEERAKREVDEEETEKEYQREREVARAKAIREAAEKASDAADAAAERLRQEARTDARQSWLDLSASVTANASEAANAIDTASNSLAAGSSAVAMCEPLRLRDESLYQSRLPGLAKRLGQVLGASLAGAPPTDSTEVAGQHGANDVDELASAVAARATALRDDKTAKKAVKKKALTDLLRALPRFGIQSARKYVPDAERSPSAWFREAPLPRPHCLDSLGAAAKEAFDAADAYYYRSMARVQRLRTVRGAAHSDLSSREVDVACGSVEHLLHILRRQRRNVAAAARVERGVSSLTDALDALRSLGGHTAPPPQERTRRWLLSQRRALDAICESVTAARLVHKAVSAAESTPLLKPGGASPAASAMTLVSIGASAAAARGRLDSFLIPAMESSQIDEEDDAGDGSWTAPPLVSTDVANALAVNFDELRAMSAKVEGAFEAAETASANAPAVIEGAAPLPGWEPLRELLLDAVGSADAYAGGASVSASADAADPTTLVDAKIDAAANVQSRVAEAATRLSESVEAATSAALVWAQNVKAAADGPPKNDERMDADDDAEEEEELPTMTYTEEALSGAMGTRRLARLEHHLADVSASLADVIDAAAASAPADAEDASAAAAIAAARVAQLAPVLALIREAVRRALAEYLRFHRSSAKLEAVLSSLVVGICAEGFCDAGEDGEGGEDGEDGGKLMDDQGGTGMGEGQGKKDVSDEIEDEEQIMGMEDMEKQEEDEGKGPDGDQKEKSKGIEMQNDFEADAKDLSDGDEEEEDDDNEEDNNGDDIDKEMGDADDENAEVIDQKMWDEEDEKEEDEDGEDGKEQGQEKYDKGSTVKQDDNQETETRAADETDAGKDDKKDKKDEGQDEPDNDNKDKNEDEGGGAGDDEDEAADDGPKDENDGVNQEEIEETGIVPKGPEEPEGGDEDDEMELPDDINLDGEDEGAGGEDGGDDDDEGAAPESEKVDFPEDDKQGEEGEGDGADADMDDQGDGGNLEEVLGDDGEENEDDTEEKEGDEDDEDAGGAAPDEPGAGDDDVDVQAGPDGAGAGGGVDDEDGEDQPKARPGEDGGDAGAGAEGDGANETKPDTKQTPPAPRYDEAGAEEDGAPDVDDTAQQALETPGGGGDGGGGGAAASAAGEGAIAPVAAGAQPPGGGAPPPPPKPNEGPGAPDATNPHRSLGDALKSWRERLSVVGETVNRDAQTGELDPDAEGKFNEYEFEQDAPDAGGGGGGEEGAGEGDKDAGTQALAGATKEQAAQAAAQGLDRADNAGSDEPDSEQRPIPEEPEELAPDLGTIRAVDDAMEIEPPEGTEGGQGRDGDADQAGDGEGNAEGDEDVEDPNKGKTAEERGAAKARKKGANTDESKPKPRDKKSKAGGAGGDAGALDEDDDGDGDGDAGEEEVVPGGRADLGEETIVALKMLEDASLEDGEDDDPPDVSHELTADEVESARAAAAASLAEYRERTASGAGHAAKAQELWRRLELLTGALSGELAEQLRLILEPTLASRLQGDFRTGKRLNMRKIIPYIASDFRKDKIWLRRSRPSQRKYQVVLAIDDSKSMAENRCGHLALESMVLLARAMARLEVGEIGVVGFGAAGGGTGDGDGPNAHAHDAVRTLHPLGAPFTDQGGPALVSQFTFSEDNTLADTPMVNLLRYLDAQLGAARENIRGGSEQLQQLCLIIADGRFHEKEALRRQMREMGSRRGLLVAFIVLDNPETSVLDMQSVTFASGKPVFQKYMDTFPFPYYTLVQDINRLPSVISDLLRQWFEITAV